jgi:hypothetical protein
MAQQTNPVGVIVVFGVLIVGAVIGLTLKPSPKIDMPIEQTDKDISNRLGIPLSEVRKFRERGY